MVQFPGKLSSERYRKIKFQKQKFLDSVHIPGFRPQREARDVGKE